MEKKLNLKTLKKLVPVDDALNKNNDDNNNNSYTYWTAMLAVKILQVDHV